MMCSCLQNKLCAINVNVNIGEMAEIGDQSWEDRLKKRIQANILHGECLNDCLKLIARSVEL